MQVACVWIQIKQEGQGLLSNELDNYTHVLHCRVSQIPEGSECRNPPTPDLWSARPRCPFVRPLCKGRRRGETEEGQGHTVEYGEEAETNEISLGCNCNSLFQQSHYVSVMRCRAFWLQDGKSNWLTGCMCMYLCILSVYITFKNIFEKGRQRICSFIHATMLLHAWLSSVYRLCANTVPWAFQRNCSSVELQEKDVVNNMNAGNNNNSTEESCRIAATILKSTADNNKASKTQGQVKHIPQKNTKPQSGEMIQWTLNSYLQRRDSAASLNSLLICTEQSESNVRFLDCNMYYTESDCPWAAFLLSFFFFFSILLMYEKHTKLCKQMWKKNNSILNVFSAHLLSILQNEVLIFILEWMALLTDSQLHVHTPTFVTSFSILLISVNWSVIDEGRGSKHREKKTKRGRRKQTGRKPKPKTSSEPPAVWSIHTQTD